MRNRAVTLYLLGLVLLLYLIYFMVQNIFFPAGEPIKSQLNHIIEYVSQNNWNEAEITAIRLVESWDRNKYLLMFNYAEEDFSLFIDNIARLKGAIKTKDDTEAVSLALSSLELWDNFNKVIPQP